MQIALISSHVEPYDLNCFLSLGIDPRMLMGVISFYDVAKTVVDSQNFENQMLKAYIRDWPSEDESAKS